MKEHNEAILPFYALGVLTEAEEAQVQAAMAASPKIQSELDALSFTAAALAYHPTPLTPSPQLKQTLFARINGDSVDRSGTLHSPQPARPAVAQRGKLWQRLFRQPLGPVLAGLSAIIIVLVGLWAGWLQWEVTRLQGAFMALQNDTAPLRAENATRQRELAGQQEMLATIDDQVAVLRQENDKLKAQLASQSQQLAAIGDQLSQLPAVQQLLVNFAQNLSTQEDNLTALTTEIAALRHQNVVLARELLAQRTVMAHATSPDVQAMALTGTEAFPQAHGQLFANPAGETAALIVYGLPPLQSGLVYKFWLVTGDQLQEAGTIEVDAEGLGMLVVTSKTAIGSYDKMGISIEPVSATDQPPENDMIMIGNLSS